MKPVKQQDQSNLKWVANFIWNIADDLAQTLSALFLVREG
jgi:type I restriction-modification system DNA methylase subunit